MEHPTGSDSIPNPYPYDTGRVSELLRHKRRVRGIKSCFPCRHRKVRCDGDVPCPSCVQRGHPELCRMPAGQNRASGSGVEGNARVRASGGNERMRSEEPGPQNGRQGHETSTSQPQISAQPVHDPAIDLMISRLENIENQISSLKADLLQVRTGSRANTSPVPTLSPSPNPRDKSLAPQRSPGKHFIEDATGATIFLGGYSDIPAALGCRQPSARDAAFSDVLVLDQLVPRTYPFTSLWDSQAGAREVCSTLPGDSDVIRYWQVYQSCAFPFYPGLVTHENFESSLFAFLDHRAGPGRGVEPEALDDTDASWLALLFAVLAGGVQFSDDPVKERDLRSKVFICSSFQCLRISNFFNNTDINQIQAMALIGQCLRNNLDTNSAWILMGATVRLAQSIGLHEETLSPQSPSSALDQYQRRRLWWMLLWQDTFLSFTYDRPPSTVNHSSTIPHDPDAGTTYSFAECIFFICQVLLDRARNQESERLPQTLTYKRRIEAVWDQAAPFLLDKARCRTLKDHLERLALRIHTCYGITRLCRLVLLDASMSVVDAAALKEECMDRAAEAVESFLDMHRLSATVCRSWAFVHNAVSCAFVLKDLAAPGSREGCARLVERLVDVLKLEERMSSWEDADTNVRCFGPYSRALRALRDSVAGDFGSVG